MAKSCWEGDTRGGCGAGNLRHDLTHEHLRTRQLVPSPGAAGDAVTQQKLPPAPKVDPRSLKCMSAAAAPVCGRTGAAAVLVPGTAECRPGDAGGGGVGTAHTGTARLRAGCTAGFLGCPRLLPALPKHFANRPPRPGDADAS